MRSRLPLLPLLLVCLVLVVLVALGPRGVLAQDAYPAQATPEAALQDSAPPAEEAYPQPERDLPPPISIETIGAGQDSGPSEVSPGLSATQTETAQPAPASSGALFLWGSFVAALLVFATAVLGSIVLFTRRHDL